MGTKKVLVRGVKNPSMSVIFACFRCCCFLGLNISNWPAVSGVLHMERYDTMMYVGIFLQVFPFLPREKLW